MSRGDPRPLLIVVLLAVAASVAPAQSIEISSGGKVIPNGGQWAIPMGSSGSRVALFSQQREPFTIRNRGTGPVTISSIRLEPAADVRSEELTIQNAAIKPGPLALPATLAPGAVLDFYVRFYPVRSGERAARLLIEPAAGPPYSVGLKGSGRDEASFTEAFVLKDQRLFGGPGTDEMVSGAVADAQGNIYFSGQVTGVADRFAYDLFYGRINADGSLAWARLWNGPWRDYSRDPGQNDETGGAGGAIDLGPDGFLYLAGATSAGAQNNNFAALVLKVDPATGTPVWERMWRPDWPAALLAKHSAEAYALDVEGGNVHVVGTTGAAVESSDALVFVLTLSASDGSVLYQGYVDPTAKTTDRAYAVRADGKGNLYIGGLAGGESLLMKLSGMGGNEPRLAWARTLSAGLGSSLNSLDVDPDGNVYAAVDRRGATTYFSFLKLDGEGALLWGRTYDGGSNKNNNCAIVKAAGRDLYVGGRTGQSLYDAQMGDALLVKVAGSDGSEIWSAFHFSGKGPDELAEHRVKAVVPSPGGLHLVGQVYTGNSNGVRYWGYWYKGAGKLSDYRPQVKDLGLVAGALKPIPQGRAIDATPARQLKDLVPALRWQRAVERTDGSPPDGELIWWRLEEPR